MVAIFQLRLNLTVTTMKLSSSKLTINVLSAVIQVVFTAFLYFFLYRYLLTTIGVKQLGVWSLILSFSSIANLANFGITSGLVKFVAEYLTEDDKSKIGKLILTSIITMTILFSVIGFIVFAGAKYFLHFIIEAEFMDVAMQILPYSLISLSINSVSGVFTSVLEGYQKNYLRNILYVFSGIIMFILVLYFTPNMKLKGVAIAQTCQAIFILIVSIIMCLSISKNNSIRFWRWNTLIFKELFNYGYKFQIVSIAQLLYEPTTKMLLSRFGGLSLLGHYEMASRLVTQFRGLLVNANQVVVPVIAEANKNNSLLSRQQFFIKMNRIIFILTIPLSTILIVFSPLISKIWIGNYENEFVISVIILTVAYMVNNISNPSYFSCLAEGKLNVLILSHVAMAIINLSAGYLLKFVWGGYGIVLGWGLAAVIGSMINLFYYLKRINLKLKNLYDLTDKLLLLISFLLLSGTWIIFLFIDRNDNLDLYISTFIITIIYLICIMLCLRKNSEIINIIKSK